MIDENKIKTLYVTKDNKEFETMEEALKHSEKIEQKDKERKEQLERVNTLKADMDEARKEYLKLKDDYEEALKKLRIKDAKEVSLSDLFGFMF